MSTTPHAERCDPARSFAKVSPSGETTITVCGECGFAVAKARDEVVAVAGFNRRWGDDKKLEVLARFYEEAVANSSGTAKKELTEIRDSLAAEAAA